MKISFVQLTKSVYLEIIIILKSTLKITSWAKPRSIFCLCICVHQSSYRQRNYLATYNFYGLVVVDSTSQSWWIGAGFDQRPSEISGRPSLFMLEGFLDVLDIGLKIKCNKLLHNLRIDASKTSKHAFLKVWVELVLLSWTLIISHYGWKLRATHYISAHLQEMRTLKTYHMLNIWNALRASLLAY